MFQLNLYYDEEKLEILYIKCINCKREICLYLKNTTFDKMITKFELNEILHHVFMLWIISPNKETKYETDKNNQ